jgi:MFS family permease
VSTSPETPKPEVDEVRIRRAPKIPAFMIVGGALGAIASLIVTSLFPVDPAVGFGPLVAYVSLYGITAGVLLGAIAALIADRVSTRRMRTVRAERTVVPRVDDELS